MTQAEDHAKRVADANLRLSAGRQMLGGQMDIYSGLQLVGNQVDAEAIRVQLHAQIDTILDAMADLARLIRAGANLQ